MDLKGKPFYLSADEERWVLDALASMDEREKTGQLFCVMGGDYPLDELRALVSDEGIGAVLYRPCPKAELAEKLAAIDAAARIPLLHAANIRQRAARAEFRTGPILQTSPASPQRTTRPARAVSPRSAPPRASQRA